MTEIPAIVKSSILTIEQLVLLKIIFHVRRDIKQIYLFWINIPIRPRQNQVFRISELWGFLSAARHKQKSLQVSLGANVNK